MAAANATFLQKGLPDRTGRGWRRRPCGRWGRRYGCGSGGRALPSLLAEPPINRYPVTLGIHALNVGVVIATLNRIGVGGPPGSAGRGSNQKTGSGAHARTTRAVNCSTRDGADHRTQGSATNQTVLACLVRALGIGLPVAKLRHSKSSNRKVSKLLLLPGRTSIEGPVGAVAHAPRATNAAASAGHRSQR